MYHNLNNTTAKRTLGEENKPRHFSVTFHSLSSSMSTFSPYPFKSVLARVVHQNKTKNLSLYKMFCVCYKAQP